MVSGFHEKQAMQEAKAEGTMSSMIQCWNSHIIISSIYYPTLVMSQCGKRYTGD
jgi:hypothetical protein